MYYNVERYIPDMERLFGDYTGYRLGQGWPAYKNMSVEKMADIIERDPVMPYTPRYDTHSGTSAVTVPESAGEIPKRDMEIMKALYGSLNKVFGKYTERVIDEYEYMESPIYNEEGIDRETLAQIVDRVMGLAEEEMDEAQETALEESQEDMWNRRNMFRNTIEAIVLNEIFAVRRPNYRRVRANYIYTNGVYDGVRER